QRSADRAWVGELCRHLRVHHGEAVAPFDDEQLREEGARGVERARAYRLYARSKVTFFVPLRFWVRPAFDEHPRGQVVMRSPGRRSPDERLVELASVMSDKDWEEARHIPPRGPSSGEAKEA